MTEIKFINSHMITENQKKNRIISIILGLPGICFLITGHVLNEFFVSMLGIILFALGMIFYGKAKQRRLLWFLLWVPLLIGFLLYYAVI